MCGEGVDQRAPHLRGTALLDEAGTETGQLPAEVFAGDLELPKRELTRLLHRHTADAVEYVFDDSITKLTQHESGVQIESACQVELDRWSHGRVALVGDAGYCAAPTSGMGTSQALIGARALANHLAVSRGDHRAGFAAYERELRPYVTQNHAAGREAAKMFGAAA